MGSGRAELVALGGPTRKESNITEIVIADSRRRMNSLQEEHDWLAEHPSEVEYSGRWIAILGGRIGAHGKSFGQTHRKATAKRPATTPLILYIPKRSEELLIL